MTGAIDPQLREQLAAALGSAYRLERELTGGGMSRVFVAEDTHLGRRIVVKVLHPDLAAEVSAARFAREIQFAAQLQHPHVVPLFTAGETGRLLYYTMPFVEGESLRQRLLREGPLPVSDVVRLVRELADALDYAHGQGVVHRDLKPENVLLSGRHATVADFGVAKALSVATHGGAEAPLGGAAQARSMAAPGSPTGTGVAIGTPAYMAPEQVAADPAADHRADLYSLGLIAYELLAGVHPFAGRSPQALLAAQLTEEPPPLTSHRSDVPPALGALIMRLRAKRPEDRPHSASEVVRLLEEIQIDGGAARLSPVQQRGPARQRATVALVLVALAVLAVFAAFLRRGPSAIERPMLVVLPFENLGPPGDEYFADGLTDEVTSRLASLSALRVIGRASARQYKGTTRGPREIARELGATHLLTGTVRWERMAGGPGRVRVSVELVRAADQASMWAEPYEASLSEVFQVQASVAERVANALDVALLARERRAVAARPTAHVAAYDAYLRGLVSSGRSARYSIPMQQAAIAEFERAVALDSAFAAAHARLGDAYVAMHDMTGDTAMLTKARASVGRAWALDSTTVESRLARARYLAAADDPEGAYRIVSSAAREAPGNAEILFRLAEAEETRGRPERGIPIARSAAALDPRSADPPAQLAGLLIKTYRYEESIPIREREISLVPENTAAYFIQASAHLLWRGDTAAARRVVERGGPALETWLVWLPLGSAGRAIWQRVVGPSILRSKDTLTVAGYSAGRRAFPPELFHLMKVRHFALSARGDRARAHAESLVVQLESALQESGDARLVAGFYARRAALAEAYAYLRRTNDASREIDRYVAETRRIRNATALPFALVNAAYVDVMIGRHDLAVERLSEALRLPSGIVISRALLRADPSWDPLRAHPWFQRLTAGG